MIAVIYTTAQEAADKWGVTWQYARVRCVKATFAGSS
jgi:hypothetical protein